MIIVISSLNAIIVKGNAAMKNRKRIAIAGIMLLSIFAYMAGSAEGLPVSPYQDSSFGNPDVVCISVEPSILENKPKSIKMRIESAIQTPIGFVEPSYSIETWKDGVWYVVPLPTDSNIYADTMVKHDV